MRQKYAKFIDGEAGWANIKQKRVSMGVNWK